MFDLCGGFLVFVFLIMSAKPVGKNRLPAAEKKAVVARYIKVCSHKNFRHRWMTAEHICEVIATEDPLDDSIDLNKNTFVDAMNNGQFKLLPMEEKNNNEGVYSNTVRPSRNRQSDATSTCMEPARMALSKIHQDGRLVHEEGACNARTTHRIDTLRTRFRCFERCMPGGIRVIR